MKPIGTIDFLLQMRMAIIRFRSFGVSAYTVMLKTVTFASLHFSIAFAVAYLLTGSVLAGGVIALVEPAINTVGFYLHERVWRRIERVARLRELGAFN
jgi:uncharacterized membrane protein